MDNNARYVIGGSELGRAPVLKKCPMCGGIADYISAQDGVRGKLYRVRCSACGLQSEALMWPENAGERWNARKSEHARVITTQEILEFRADQTDDRGDCALWMETIEGDITALVLEVSASEDGREVYEHGYGDFWDRDKVDAEGIKWRLWDKRPTTADTNREPWGQVGFQIQSESARAEAGRIRAELDVARAEDERRRAEAMRRHCLYCANYVPVDTEGKDLGSAAPFVCALDGHLIEHPGSERCGAWTMNKREGCFA